MSITVDVRNGNVEQAMRVLKRKVMKEGIVKELRERQSFEKPSEKREEKRKKTLLMLRKIRRN